MMKILFVCLGNICRSPLADGVFRHLATQIGQQPLYEIDSAGTGGWHIGNQSDRRMRKVAALHGVSLDDIRARQFVVDDFDKFDLILAMDESNLQSIKAKDKDKKYQHKIKLFREYDLLSGGGDVPDPYYGGPAGFENVYDIVERTCKNLLDELQN